MHVTVLVESSPNIKYELILAEKIAIIIRR